MVKVEMIEGDVALVTPKGKLTKEDFEAIAAVVDPHIEKRGVLHGLIIEAESFPGWEDFAGLVSHIRFVGEHHQAIERIALVSDAKIADIGPKLVGHFVKAEVKHFSFEAASAARLWAAHRI